MSDVKYNEIMSLLDRVESILTEVGVELESIELYEDQAIAA